MRQAKVEGDPQRGQSRQHPFRWSTAIRRLHDLSCWLLVRSLVRVIAIARTTILRPATCSDRGKYSFRPTRRVHQSQYQSTQMSLPFGYDLIPCLTETASVFSTGWIQIFGQSYGRCCPLCSQTQKICDFPSVLAAGRTISPRRIYLRRKFAKQGIGPDVVGHRLLVHSSLEEAGFQ